MHSIQMGFGATGLRQMQVHLIKFELAEFSIEIYISENVWKMY